MKKYSSSIIMFINIIISYFLINGLKIFSFTLYSFLIFLHIIIFYLYRYRVLIKNFIGAINKSKIKDREQIKSILYFNFLNLVFNIILVYFRFIENYYTFNLVILYPEIAITTIFNIPILYIIIGKLTNNKLILFLIRVLLIFLIGCNIYLVIDGEFLKSLIIMP